MAFNFLSIVIFVGILNTVYSASITVYDNSFRTIPLENFIVNEGTCVNLNFYNDKISSIDPHGGCVKVWEHKRCSGKKS